MGNFAFNNLPSNAVEPYTIEVITPSGAKLFNGSYTATDVNNTININLLPEGVTILTAATGLIPSQKLKGKAIDKNAEIDIKNAQIILWEVPANSTQRIPFAVTQTDNTGSFSVDLVEKSYNQVWATGVSYQNDTDIEIPLDANGKLPDFAYLVLDNAQIPANIDDCACHDNVPLGADGEELAVNNQYTQDIGGACINFTKPNRVLEEKDYYQVIRTTEPKVNALDVPNPALKPATSMSTTVPKADLSYLNIQNPLPVGKSGDPFLKDNTSPIGGFDTNKQAAAYAALPEEIPNSVVKELLKTPELFNAVNLWEACNEYKMAQLQKQIDFSTWDSGSVDSFGRLNMDENHHISWDESPRIYQATTIAHGHLLHFKQQFKAAGYSMGDLLFSLPLAPGQKKQVVTFDWDRKEAASRSEELAGSEALTAYLDRDRDIAEITEGTIKEHITGSSTAKTKAWGMGGGLGAMIPAGGVPIGAMLGVSGGSSKSSSTANQDSSRDSVMNMNQQLHDKTMQSASSLRSQRSTVVQAVEEGETYSVQSEVVANYNHCHALTIQYFEVLRHFTIEQHLADVQECLFIPMDMSLFTDLKSLRWKDILRNHLPISRRNVLQHPLYKGFDAIHRLKTNFLYNGAIADEIMTDFDGKMNLSIRVTMPADTWVPPVTTPVVAAPVYNYQMNTWVNPQPIVTPGYYKVDAIAWGPYLKLMAGSPYDATYITNTFAEMLIKDRTDIFYRDMLPIIIHRILEDLQMKSTNEQNILSTLSIDFHVTGMKPAPMFANGRKSISAMLVNVKMKEKNAINLKRRNVQSLQLGLYNNDSSLAGLNELVEIKVNQFRMGYRTLKHSGTLIENNNLGEQIDYGLTADLYCPPNADELRLQEEEDNQLRKDLLKHLNNNLEYYHKIIWWNMDNDRRYMMLDGFIAPNAQGRSVASVVENRLIGIVGNCLVMPVVVGTQLDPTYAIDPNNPATLLDHYKPTTPLAPYRISVPTRGVFAEAVQGACNSCEKTDDTRYWKFEEHPIPDNPTAINAINTPTPQVTAQNLTAKDFAQPLISIQNAPNAPDPQGFAALSALLSNPNFKDMTGLDQNQKNALEAYVKAQGTALSYGEGAAKLAQATADYDLKDKKMLLDNKDKIMDGIDSSNMTPEQKAKAKEQYWNKITGKKLGGGGQNNALPQNEEDMAAYTKTLKAAGLSDEDITKVIKTKAGLSGKKMSEVFTPEVIASLEKIDPEVANNIVNALKGEGDITENADALQGFIDGLAEYAEQQAS